MSVINEIAEARASALALREAAAACGPAQRALKVRLAVAAESLSTMTLLATRALDRIEEVQLELAHPAARIDKASIGDQPAKVSP